MMISSSDNDNNNDECLSLIEAKKIMISRWKAMETKGNESVSWIESMLVSVDWMREREREREEK